MMINVSKEFIEMLKKVDEYEKYNPETGEFYLPEGTPQEIVEMKKRIKEVYDRIPECFK